MARNRRLIVLVYHRVLPCADELVPDQTDRKAFQSHAKVLAQYFNVVPLSDGVRRMKNGTLPSRAVSITFDDGYRDNRQIALPLLEQYGLTATFYIATGFLNGGRMWNDTVIELVRNCRDANLDLTRWGFGTWPLRSLEDRRRAISSIISQLKYRDWQDRNRCVSEFESASGLSLPYDLMMNTEDIHTLHESGMEIGAHTIHHPILSKVDRETAYAEISNSKTFLERMLHTKISSFAYPNGWPGTDYDTNHVEMVRHLGFENAVSTQPGCANGLSDPYQLPRIGVWDRGKAKFALRMMRQSYSIGSM